METDWFKLNDARLQLTTYTKPHPHVAAATSFTPAGPTAAGKHGLGLLSVAGADDERFSRTWGWVEEAAAESGREVSRADWKVVVTFHLAETREEAMEDLRFSYPKRAYAGDTRAGIGSGIGGIGPAGATIEEAVQNGLLAGTPDDLIAKIEEIQERSGGIGGILALAHEWADTAATHRSYELFARYVMPRFQGQLDSLVANRDWFEGSMSTIFRNSGAATVKAFADAGKELPPEFAARQAEAARRRAEREAAATTAASETGAGTQASD
jgi:limonene 1,2-monooxygenase